MWGKETKYFNFGLFITKGDLCPKGDILILYISSVHLRSMRLTKVAEMEK